MNAINAGMEFIAYKTFASYLFLINIIIIIHKPIISLQWAERANEQYSCMWSICNLPGNFRPSENKSRAIDDKSC